MKCFQVSLKPAGFGLLFLLYLFISANSRTVRAESDFFSQIREEAKKIKSLQADFVQQKQMKILLRPLVSKGRFFFRAPSSIRWEYVSPVNSIVVMHQGKMRRVFKKNGQVIQDSGANLQAMQIVMQNIAHWLSGRFDENPDFIMTLTPPRILLTPLKPMPGMMDRIELLFSDRPGILDSITIYENKENYTKIAFKSLKINGPIADSVFQEIP